MITVKLDDAGGQLINAIRLLYLKVAERTEMSVLMETTRSMVLVKTYGSDYIMRIPYQEGLPH